MKRFLKNHSYITVSVTDRKGYIVWDEHPNSGLNHTEPQSEYGGIRWNDDQSG